MTVRRTRMPRAQEAQERCQGAMFRAALSRAGLARMRTHDVRHTFASLTVSSLSRVISTETANATSAGARPPGRDGT